ncbi:MAG: hypothetical protein J7M11_06910, partial [Elusimicrobia bacterium]|nr:hypothetical protein [Elusimicrobiota bacterium]
MKNFIKGLCVMIVVCSVVRAGTISGNIAYSGSSVTTTVLVFDDPAFDADPIAMSTMNAPGAYSVSDAVLADGVDYYVICVAPTVDLDHIKDTDPWSCYMSTNSVSSPDAVQLSSGAATADMVMVDGNPPTYPNPFARPIYEIETDLRYNGFASTTTTSFNVYLYAADIRDPHATSVVVNGLGATDMLLDHSDAGLDREWKNVLSTKEIMFPSAPALPLYYDYTITDGAGADVYYSTITASLTEFPTNFLPAQDENLVASPTSISWDWTGTAVDYFNVCIIDRGTDGSGWTTVWNSNDLAYAGTSYSADCSAAVLTSGNYYSYIIHAYIEDESAKSKISSSFTVDFRYNTASGGNITGTISYAGASTGDLYVMAGHGDPSTWKDTPSLVEYSNNLGPVTMPYSYDTGSIPAASDYNVFAWIDSTADGVYDSSSEAGAV